MATDRVYRERDLARINAFKNAAKQRNRDYANKIKEKTPCKDCGVSYPYYVMDFDHCRGDKGREVSLLVNAPASIERLQAEIDKCDVVCANCHRQRTYGRMFGKVRVKKKRVLR